MADLRVQCPACRGVLQVPAAQAGQLARCGQCGLHLHIAGVPAAEAPSARRRTPVRRRGPTVALVAAGVTAVFALLGLAGGTYLLWTHPGENRPQAKAAARKNLENKAPKTPVSPNDRLGKSAPPDEPAEPPETQGPPTLPAEPVEKKAASAAPADPPLLREGEPVLYPAPGHAEVPLAFPGNEVPDPLPPEADKLAGYPITVTFPPSVRVRAGRAVLHDEAGAEVPAWLSTPERPANQRHAREQRNSLCLIPKAILRPATRYVVHAEATVAGKPWSRTWSFTTESADEWQRRIREHVLPRLNLHRRVAGLGPMTCDEDLSRGCVAHARYLTQNMGRVPNLRPNEELPDLPGYTEEGSHVARGTANFQGQGAEPAGAVEQMLATVRFRPMVLNPHGDRVGLGADLRAPAGWFWVVYLPPVPSRGPALGAVVYPGPGQRDVPSLLGEPLANLVKGQPPEARAGYPVTAAFGLKQKVRAVKATLGEKDGSEVPCWLSTPEKPLPGAGPFRQVVLIPKAPLQPATAYTATMSAEVDGQPWARSWSFTTADPRREEERMAEVLLRRLNAVRRQAGLAAVALDERLSRGCRLHAAYVAGNLGHPKVEGLSIHDEDPSLPGYSEEGARAGAASVIALTPDAAEAVDSWVATLYHRLPLLDPQLRHVGYGQAAHPTRGWVTVLNANSGTTGRAQ